MRRLGTPIVAPALAAANVDALFARAKPMAPADRTAR